MAQKPHMNLVFIGHVDHGKSTTVGRLLYDTGAIDEQTLKKLKEKAAELGKAGFEFAFVMDKVKEEQERGVTIDLSYKKFETQKYYFTIIDAPGHKDFIKNMITGTSQSDAAVLVVAANDSVMEQTKEHAYLAKTLGVGQIIIAVNKMDMVNYDEAKFNAVKDDVSKLLSQIGYKIDEVPFIPISSLQGENIAKKTEKMAWYKGKNLLETLDTLKPVELPTKLPMRMPIQDVYTITGIGTVPVGRIETGVMKVGEKLMVMPSGKTGELKSIEMHHEQMPTAQPGDNVGISIRGIGKDDMRRGDVLGPATNPATVAKNFTARIIVLNHPTVFTVGYTPVFHINTSQVSCKVVKITKKIDPKTGQVVQENPDFLKNGEAAEIVVEPTRPLCIEKNSDVPQLSKFAIRDMGRTVAAGMCIDLEKK
ncbi:translation elongation factor EF-1 subunit alpha [Candidatus Woesearchaeota archaeon]|nr:translation elongation factor EF-1 subunit alpha [Candidatus Woesearchaeota archaeon]MBT4248189.1 translation elongation factor EF-1 subunit alpha [Candidatus Woesearchaeota archaeon]